MMSRSNGKDDFAASSFKPASAFHAELVESGKGSFEVIDSAELAARWQVPESWIRNRTRARTPEEERIPCLRLGRYVRFEWGSPRLAEWLEKQRQ
jgi:hypothetical protein